MKQMPRSWLAKIRVDMGLNQTEFAKKVGISRNYLSEIETGKRNPSVEVAKKIAKAIGNKWTKFF